MRRKQTHKSCALSMGLTIGLLLNLFFALVMPQTILASENESSPDNNSAALTVEVFQSLDGSEDVADPLSVKSGDTIHYYTVVTNKGETIREPIAVQSFVDEGLKCVPESVSDGGRIGYNDVTWQIDTLLKNESRVFSYDIIVPYQQDGQWFNHSQVTIGNQVLDSEKIWMKEPGLAPFTTEAHIVKVDSGISYENMEVQPGDELRFTFQVTNNASTPTKKVVIKTDNEKNLIINKESISDGGVLKDNQIRWEVPSLQPGRSVQVYYTATIPDHLEDSRYRTEFQVHSSEYPNPIKAVSKYAIVGQKTDQKENEPSFYEKNKTLIDYGIMILVLLILLGVGLKMWIDKYSHQSK